MWLYFPVILQMFCKILYLSTSFSFIFCGFFPLVNYWHQQLTVGWFNSLILDIVLLSSYLFMLVLIAKENYFASTIMPAIRGFYKVIYVSFSIICMHKLYKMYVSKSWPTKHNHSSISCYNKFELAINKNGCLYSPYNNKYTNESAMLEIRLRP